MAVSRDRPYVQFNFIVDLLYSVLDKRIRLYA